MRTLFCLTLSAIFGITLSAEAPKDAPAPRSETPGPVITKEFRVIPKFFGPSSPKTESELLRFFQSRGTSFSDTASVKYGEPKPNDPQYLIIIVRNHQKQLDWIETLIDEWHKKYDWQ